MLGFLWKAPSRWLRSVLIAANHVRLSVCWAVGVMGAEGLQAREEQAAGVQALHSRLASHTGVQPYTQPTCTGAGAHIGSRP